MINFTVGPVQTFDYVKKIGGEDVPYFRTSDFSNIMFENEEMIKKMLKAQDSTRVMFLTGSGTAAMEAAVINLMNEGDRGLVINGGSFGQRFCDILDVHHIGYDQVKLKLGENVTNAILNEYGDRKYKALFVNACETSTGVHYDIDLLANFCKNKGILLVIDAVSSFLADEIDMSKLDAAIILTGSQKALACHPGISIMACSARTIEIIKEKEVGSFYLNLKIALQNAARGQTPFTPAVGTLLQIHERLKHIMDEGGVISENRRINELAFDFRQRIKGLPFDFVSCHMSNAVTALKTRNFDAKKIFEKLKNDYEIWVCPNGGSLGSSIFRVGHLGNLTIEDNKKLVSALKELNNSGFFNNRL